MREPRLLLGGARLPTRHPAASNQIRCSPWRRRWWSACWCAAARKGGGKSAGGVWLGSRRKQTATHAVQTPQQHVACLYMLQRMQDSTPKLELGSRRAAAHLGLQERKRAARVDKGVVGAEQQQAGLLPAAVALVDLFQRGAGRCGAEGWGWGAVTAYRSAIFWRGRSIKRVKALGQRIQLG